jgi:hypothetical protein
MLNLISSINSNVEGYIFEVLHREYLNIVTDFEIDSIDAKNTNPDYSWLNALTDETAKLSPKNIKTDVNINNQNTQATTTTATSLSSKSPISDSIVSTPSPHQHQYQATNGNYDQLVDYFNTSNISIQSTKIEPQQKQQDQINQNEEQMVFLLSANNF